MEKNTVQPTTSSSAISWIQFTLGFSSIVKFHNVPLRERERERGGGGGGFTSLNHSTPPARCM